ncbi:hypothetical protein JCM8547_005316 [Rhodosporidiobolus lusitaniae]
MSYYDLYVTLKDDVRRIRVFPHPSLTWAQLDGLIKERFHLKPEDHVVFLWAHIEYHNGRFSGGAKNAAEVKPSMGRPVEHVGGEKEDSDVENDFSDIQLEDKLFLVESNGDKTLFVNDDEWASAYCPGDPPLSPPESPLVSTVGTHDLFLSSASAAPSELGSDWAKAALTGEEEE